MTAKVGSLADYQRLLEGLETLGVSGRVTRVTGTVVEGVMPECTVGQMCHLMPVGNHPPALAEVVGFQQDKVILMPLGEMRGLSPGCPIEALAAQPMVPVGESLLGRVLDGMGRPLDDKGELPYEDETPLYAEPINPFQRRRIKKPIDVGIRSLNALATICEGQRMAIMAGSGVGKSTLLGMMARNTSADINVIGLVGERGRELNDFLERDLGEEGLKRSVVVTATSEAPALVRVRAAFVATAIAEWFRGRGKNVLLMMDSVTRFAMAQREVGLAAGEPPTSKGYTPSVFALLPKLLERAGMPEEGNPGSITGIYTVLVEGDDMNEPIADSVRSILDGHTVLSRDLAERNHYPAIDILASVSRLMPDVVDPEHMEWAGKVLGYLASYQKAETLINIGAYARGSNPEIDKAIAMHDEIMAFLRQGLFEQDDYETCKQKLAAIARKKPDTSKLTTPQRPGPNNQAR